MKLLTATLPFALFLHSGITFSQEGSMSPCDEVEEKVAQTTDDKEVKLLAAFTPAKVIERVNPRYPMAAARKGAEGWVRMSYVVDEQGNVKDPVIEDSGGHKGFKKAALKSVKKWKFEPAQKDGVPVEQCKSSVQLEFMLNQQPGASRKFVRKYKEADKFVNSGNLEQAEVLLADLHELDERNRYENAWLWSLESTLANKKKDFERERVAISKTIASMRSHKLEDQTFGDDYTNYLFQRLFILQVNAHRFGDALATIEKINSRDNAEELLRGIDAARTYLSNLLNSEENIFVEAGIAEEGNYFHNLARQSFSFVDVEGELETVEVRCDTRREIYSVAPDNIWTIPESWGKCHLLITGDEDTTFHVVEVAQS